MLGPRRFLPSLSLLAAFEAAARTGSVTAAAKEVHLTQGAVSRQIRSLEHYLEVQLFVRDRQTIRLTLAGESYAREIRDALRQISTASLNLRANPHGGTLNLAVPSDFGDRWLAPRLAKFVSANPGIRINIRSRNAPIDFRHDPMDMAIQFGANTWEGLCVAPLRHEIVTPYCAPAFRKKWGLSRPGELKKVPTLHLTTRPDAWEQWFLRHGVGTDGTNGMLFDQFSTMAQAAIAGVGVTLLPTFLFEPEIESGALVPALNLQMISSERYYLVYPPDRATYVPLIAFRDWILAELPSDRETF